jgi:O-antigen ligase
MTQKIYLTILKSGIYLSFLSVFLVYSKLLFPYITSKQIYFNILIEILLVFWLAFIIKYPSWRPKKSWISIGLISYFSAILISSIFSVDFNLSFWGDVERMLGFFHVFHFLVFYFIIITVFRTKEDWRNLMIASVIAGVIIAIYGLAKISYSTIGNAAYVGGYLIFNIYFSLILYFKTKNLPLRISYLVAIIIMLFAVKNTGIAGAYVGLGVSVILLVFLFGILNKNKKIKISSISLFILSVIVVASVFVYKDKPFVQNNKLLNQITSEVSLSKNTFQTRLISWKAAWTDFPSHPILGAGYGNFSISFDKYFDPVFYNYTRSETYFDRAHNNIVDIASTTGILGLFTYLSIIIAVGYYLVTGYRKGKVDLYDFVLLSSLIVAYFIQNLAVFDSLVTYISLMIALGFIYWLNIEHEELQHEEDKNLTNPEIASFLIVGLVMLTILYQYNIKPLKMLKGSIDGQIAFAQNDIIGGVEAYKKALSYNTILDRDSRDSLIRLMSNTRPLNMVSKEEAGEILDFIIGESDKNIAYNPKDSLALLEHSQLLNVAATIFKDDTEKFYYYSNLALEAINKSIESAPGRIPHYFMKVQVYITRGDYEKATNVLSEAVSLNEDYYESICRLAKIQVITENDEGYDNMNKCIDKGGVGQVSPANFVAQLINYYNEKGDSERVLKLMERLSQLDSGNAKIWANLANLYVEAGEKEKAIEAATKVGELDPGMKDEADSFIRGLEE